MPRATAIGAMLLSLSTLPFLLAAADGVAKETLLSGRITAIDEEKSVLTFKAGSKNVEIYFGKARLIRHETVPLRDVPEGTAMHAFARRTLMTSTLYYLEQFVVLVAGPLEYPPYLERNEEKPHWETGPLSFADEGNTMYIGSDRLNCGKDRPICVIRQGNLADYYELDKKGKVVGKSMFIRGSMKVEMKDGKAEERFVATQLILPTTGIPKEEYGYILQPERLNEEKAAGKR